MHDYSQYDVVLLPTFIQVEAFRKRRALACSRTLKPVMAWHWVAVMKNQPSRSGCVSKCLAQ